MISEIIPSISNREKEVTILDIIKESEKNNKNLRIAIFGEYDEWIKKWIAKRGHRLDESGKDISIYLDYKLSKTELAIAKKRSKKVAVIYPSGDIAKLPSILSKKVSLESSKNDEITEDAETRDLAYGMWKASYYNFTELPARFEFSVFFFLLALLILTTGTNYPRDDLLRHAKAYLFDFDYSNLFAYSWNFSFDPYILFDMFLGALDEAFGIHALRIIQALCLITFTIGFFLHTKKWSQNFRIFVYVLVLLIIGSRIELARPAVFEAFLFVIGLSLTGIPAAFLGILMGTIYYLFPIFLAPLALIKREYIVGIIIALAFWVFYAGTGFFEEIYFFASGIITNRLFSINENESILKILASPFFLILAFMFIKSRNFKYWIPLAFFLLFNQMRFMDIIVPLLAISLDEKKLGFDKIHMGSVAKLFFIGIMIASLQISFSENHLEEIKLHDAIVFCDSMECMFNVAYYSENIGITPSMEIGLTDKAIQLGMRQVLYNGTLNCSLFDDYSYDLLVESSLQEIPECLELEEVHGEYRVWRVIQ